MKTLGTLLILIASFTLAAPAHADDAIPAQESLMRPGCQNFYTADTDLAETMSLDKWVDIDTKIYARQCYDASTQNRWVDPINVEFSYNAEGGHESCGFFDTFEGVRYHLYLKDGTGRNYAHPTVVLDCEGDTTGWTIESLASAPSDFRMCGRPPVWKMNWTVKIDNANDKSGSMGKTLWAFTGPVKDECDH